MNKDELKQFLQRIESFRKLQKKSFPKEIDLLYHLTSFLPENAGLSQRAWHVLNDVYQPVLCSICNSPVKWWAQYKRYRSFCSNACIGKSKEIKQKREQTNINNFGTPYAAQNKDVLKTMKQTLNENYGVDHPLQNEVIKQKTTKTWEDNFDIEIKHFSTSKGEKEVFDFIQTIYSGAIKQNDRTIIPPYEIDILIPNHNLAIEYCGLYWHSEQLGKDRNYHKNKYQLCRQKGIQLLTIFEDEWEFNKDIVKQKIMYMLNLKNDLKIYARKTQVQIPTLKEKKQFLDQHHIQGNGPGSLNYCLTYYSELIAVMSLIEKEDLLILNRYATSCLIPGGFSKLLNVVKNKHKGKDIVTFADLRWSNGDLYLNNGFVIDKQLKPDYFIIKDNKRFHKFQFRHKFLKNKLKHYDPMLTEKQNCDNNGILRIWDCGKIKFRLKNEQ